MKNDGKTPPYFVPLKAVKVCLIYIP